MVESRMLDDATIAEVAECELGPAPPVSEPFSLEYIQLLKQVPPSRSSKILVLNPQIPSQMNPVSYLHHKSTQPHKRKRALSGYQNIRILDAMPEFVGLEHKKSGWVGKKMNGTVRRSYTKAKGHGCTSVDMTSRHGVTPVIPQPVGGAPSRKTYRQQPTCRQWVRIAPPANLSLSFQMIVSRSGPFPPSSSSYSR